MARYELVNNKAKPRYEIVGENTVAAPVESTEPQNEESFARKFIKALISGQLTNPAGAVGAKIAEQAAPIAGEDILNMIGSGAQTLIGGAPGAVEQASTDPLRTLRNVGAGAVELGQGFANFPSDYPNILGHLGFIKPETAKKISDFIPRTPDLTQKLNEFVGGEQTAADDLIRGLIKNAPITFPAAKAAGTLALKSGKLPRKVFGTEDKAISAQEREITNLLENQGKKVEEATSKYQTNIENLTQAQEEAQQEIGKSNPALLAFRLKNKNKSIDQMLQESGDLKAKLTQPEYSPASLQEAETNLQQAQGHHQRTQELANEAETNISQHLNQGATHDVRVASYLDQAVGNIEKQGSEAYKGFLKRIENSNIQMPEQVVKSYAVDMDKIREMVKSGNLAEVKKGNIGQTNEENPALTRLLREAPKASDTNAVDFLRKYQDFKSARHDLLQEAKNADTHAERQQLFDAYKKSQEVQDQATKALEEGLGNEATEFKRINKLYSDVIYPLRGNSIVKKVKSKGQLPDNIMKATRGTEEGMPLVRQLIKQDPETLKNVVGQRYANNVQELQTPNELTQEFLNEMPELQNLVGRHAQATEAIPQAAENVQTARTQHAEATANQKEAAKMQSQIDKHQTDVNKYQQEIPIIKNHMETIRKHKNSKKISLKEKLAAETEFKRLEKELKATKEKLEQSTTGLKKAWLLTKTAYKIGKKFI